MNGLCEYLVGLDARGFAKEAARVRAVEKTPVHL